MAIIDPACPSTENETYPTNRELVVRKRRTLEFDTQFMIASKLTFFFRI